jgi:hypothetical protein
MLMRHRLAEAPATWVRARDILLIAFECVCALSTMHWSTSERSG